MCDLCESCVFNGEGFACEFYCSGVTNFDMINEIVVECDDYIARED